MKFLAKETKSKIYFKVNDEVFMGEKANTANPIEKINLFALQEQQLSAILRDDWQNLGDFETINDAYSAFISNLEQKSNSRKQEIEIIENKKDKEWAKLQKLSVIPATVDNIYLLLRNLNKQNWGSWHLPKLSIGYSANQYDCDGIIATTIKLNKPISDKKWGIKNETMFKVGGRNGHLNKYQSL